MGLERRRPTCCVPRHTTAHYKGRGLPANCSFAVRTERDNYGNLSSRSWITCNSGSLTKWVLCVSLFARDLALALPSTKQSTLDSLVVSHCRSYLAAKSSQPALVIQRLPTDTAYDRCAILKRLGWQIAPVCDRRDVDSPFELAGVTHNMLFIQRRKVENLILLFNYPPLLLFFVVFTACV
jgi:hypothetical protein